MFSKYTIVHSTGTINYICVYIHTLKQKVIYMCVHIHTHTHTYTHTHTHTYYGSVTSTVYLKHVMKLLRQSNAADGSLMKTKPPVTLLVW